MRKNICIALSIIYCSLSSSVNAQALLLAISEGTSGGLDAAQVIAKYKDVGDAIGRGMKASVNVVFVRDFATLSGRMQACLPTDCFLPTIFLSPTVAVPNATRSHRRSGIFAMKRLRCPRRASRSQVSIAG